MSTAANRTDPPPGLPLPGGADGHGLGGRCQSGDRHHRAGGTASAAATLDTAQTRSEIEKIIAATGSRNFGLNFHMFQENAGDCVDLAIEYGLKAVSYGRGPDAATVRRFKDAGVLCIPTVGAVKHAIKAVQMGADMITIQGGEGGGHTGGVPSSILLPQVLDAVNVPVIAAGGFSTGRGRPRPGCWCLWHRHGHALSDEQESPTPAATLERYLKVNDPQQIRVTLAVDGMRHRMIENAFINRTEKASGLGRLLIALRSARSWKQQTGMSSAHALDPAQGAQEEPEALSQTIMASINRCCCRSPCRTASRTRASCPPAVAAAIAELASCEAIISEIVAQAEACLTELYQRNAQPKAVAGSAL